MIRDLIGCYVAGYRNIEVKSKLMSSVQKNDVRQIVNKLIGPEILEETNNKVTIHDSHEELQTSQALKRIKNIVRSLIEDSISSLVNANNDLALDVIQRDNDVDRLNLLVMRQFMEILRSRSTNQGKMDSITACTYMQAASNLERIADHALRIAETTGKCKCTIDVEVTKSLSRLKPIIIDLIDDAVSCLLQTDCEKANDIINRARDVRRVSEESATLTDLRNGEEMLVRLVVAGSIERMLDYIMNLGELAINLRMSSLQSDS